jgi:homoserine O-succinyltransferase/O-acetyltransferase
MPLIIDTPAQAPIARVSDIFGVRLRGVGEARPRIKIGLVNNMPDSALAATERQFSRLLEAASGEVEVELRFYALKQIPRSPEALEHLAQRYVDAGALRGQTLDALIVTGAQPLAADLVDEPYWRALVGVIDWAEANTISTVLSCLAAHAGVLHFSGVERRRLPAKRSGVYAFEVAREDRLTYGAGEEWVIPHSRYNGLDEAELAQNGYEVLTRSDAAGVDMFIKRSRSLFVFLQGHPEYENDTLAREFRRDMGRYLSGELASPPDLPRSYYSPEIEDALMRFRAKAESERRSAAASLFPESGLRGVGEAPWRGCADLLYRNWLSFIAERKAEFSQEVAASATRWGG